jgi:transposase
VSEVARRCQVCPQQVFGWRRAARQAAPAEPPKASVTRARDVVPIVAGAAAAAAPERKADAAPIIEVKLASATVRVLELGDGAELTAAVRASRASAAKA